MGQGKKWGVECKREIVALNSDWTEIVQQMKISKVSWELVWKDLSGKQVVRENFKERPLTSLNLWFKVPLIVSNPMIPASRDGLLGKDHILPTLFCVCLPQTPVNSHPWQGELAESLYVWTYSCLSAPSQKCECCGCWGSTSDHTAFMY